MCQLQRLDRFFSVGQECIEQPLLQILYIEAATHANEPVYKINLFDGQSEIQDFVSRKSLKSHLRAENLEDFLVVRLTDWRLEENRSIWINDLDYICTDNCRHMRFVGSPNMFSTFNRNWNWNSHTTTAVRAANRWTIHFAVNASKTNIDGRSGKV